MVKHYYVYYSYEEWGRGYIGSRACSCLPKEDIKYFGSFKDKAFKPSQKVILQTFKTRKEAILAEITLHKFYKVGSNPHFANKAEQTSVGFSFSAQHSNATKEAISRAHKGKTWWTNGVQSILAFECPTGYFKGRHSPSKKTRKKMSTVRLGNKNCMYGRGGKSHPLYGKRWFTNGVKSIFSFECPEGFYPGRTLKKLSSAFCAWLIFSLVR